MFLKNSLLICLFIFKSIIIGNNKETRQCFVSKNIYETTEDMANFRPVIEKTFKFEGGYQAMSSDPANYNSLGELVGTNRGISAKAWEAYFHRPPTVEDIKAVTEELAMQIYKKNYWDMISGDNIRSQAVADIIFALFIGNPSKSNQITEDALAEFGHILNVKNPYSDEVVKAINSINAEKLFDSIKAKQLNFVTNMRAEIAGGWTNKISSYEYERNKKKWLIISVVLIAIISISYYGYKQGYHKRIIRSLKFGV